MAEIEMMEASSSYSDMTLISESEEAEAEPSDVRLILFCEPVDTITLNTDLMGYASLDDGTTWEQVTLSDEGDYDSGKSIFSGDEEMTSQSDQTMRWKVVTANGKHIRLHGVQLQWE